VLAFRAGKAFFHALQVMLEFAAPWFELAMSDAHVSKALIQTENGLLDEKEKSRFLRDAG